MQEKREGKIFYITAIAVLFALFPLFFLGCSAPGVVKTGFFKSYDYLTPRQGGVFDIPSYYYLAPSTDMNKYKKVIIPDFESITTENDLLMKGGSETKDIKKDAADFIAQVLEGQVFEKCVRTSAKMKYDDIEAIKQIPADVADAVLMGNISDFRVGRRGVSDQFEIKLVDIKTGEEILQVVDNNSSKINMAIKPSTAVRLLRLLKWAKGMEPLPQPQARQKGFGEI